MHYLIQWIRQLKNSMPLNMLEDNETLGFIVWRLILKVPTLTLNKSVGLFQNWALDPFFLVHLPQIWLMGSFVIIQISSYRITVIIQITSNRITISKTTSNPNVISDSSKAGIRINVAQNVCSSNVLPNVEIRYESHCFMWRISIQCIESVHILNGIIETVMGLQFGHGGHK